MNISTLPTEDDLVAERIEHYRNREIERLREGFRRSISHLQDDAEKMTDYCRRLIREEADVSEELNELRAGINGLLLVVALLQREAGE